MTRGIHSTAKIRHGDDDDNCLRNRCSRRRRQTMSSFFALLLLVFVQQSTPFAIQFLQQKQSSRYTRQSTILHLAVASNATEQVAFSTDTKEPASSSSSSSSTSNSTSWIDPDLVASLKESIDLVSVVESYNLAGFDRKSATRATALCPFHDDHTPSLSVDGTRGMFKCFACNAAGDVFKFVQLYHTKSSQLHDDDGGTMTFPQAIAKVATEYGDASHAVLMGLSKSSSSSSSVVSPAVQLKRDRIHAANAAAAAYYAQCLLEPWAGSVRAYVRSRKLSPVSVRSFVIGFAPDMYYGSHKRQTWGDGSLVEHLRQLEFTPQEIVESGLAIVSRKYDSILVDSNATSSIETETMPDYNDIMDRFRNRLMVPIKDATGKHVLGFGGRDLPKGSMPNDFQGPKYLNSPETLVFHKSKVLFGLHKVNDLIASHRSTAKHTSVVIVEGYMDAISLWAAGVTGAVASMGTALSRDQLALAAQAARKMNGRVILCMDNDAAGIAAMELVCSNGLLKDATRRYSIQYLIARLPDGCKDPAEYIESLIQETDGEKAANEFDRIVLAQAPDWTQFYLSRILSSYNASAPRGSEGSFGNVFDRAADFIADTMDAAERTKSAYEVAGLLAQIVATESNETDISSVVHSQLDSDLINSVSRKADAKEALLRRAETAALTSGDSTPKKMMSSITMGGSTTIVDDEDKLSRQAKETALNSSSPQRRASINRLMSKTTSESPDLDEQSSVERKPRTFKIKRERKLIPHFDGFEFENDLDAAWLGFEDEYRKQLGSRFRSGNLLRGSSSKGRIYGPFNPSTDESEDSDGLYRLGRPVFFNSNKFHGRKCLTEQAATAGYTYDVRAIQEFDTAMIQNGIGFGPLARMDFSSLLQSCESELLTTLIRHPAARKAMKSILMARSALDVDNDLDWSSIDREWLFNKLLSESYIETLNLDQMRDYLVALSDCPNSAFVSNIHDSPLAVASSAVGPHEPGHRRDGENEKFSLLLDGMDFETTVLAPAEHEPYPEVNGEAARLSISFSEDDDFQPKSQAFGTLDHFFAEAMEDSLSLAEDGDNDRQSGSQRELAVQILYCTHQWAAASQRSVAIQHELKEVFANSGIGVEANSTGDVVQQKKDIYLQLTAELKALTEKRVSLSESLTQISAKLLYTSNEEASMSSSLQASLAAAVDEYTINSPPDRANMLDDNSAGVDCNNEETVEQTDKRLDLEYGDYCDPDFQWSPDDVVAERRLPDTDDADDDHEESLEEFEARFNQEWAGWLD